MNKSFSSLDIFLAILSGWLLSGALFAKLGSSLYQTVIPLTLGVGIMLIKAFQKWGR